ncbi:MAG TPA: chemotaxis protein CheW [Bacteroidales bacterium]|nr:MAG: hypothetical protein A2W98_08395 [Bacteroidetes bacterium GWF2_33_38]OFY88877.1 MAG: hypothetical protein A2236_02260 [Bacteroidetes bacterium RIFOXYA2_FULL_33_7]HBF89020.1 chemotaxis protein CheW [Bacteroidales bacterium]
MVIEDKTNSYLSFSLGNETYAAHVKSVLNILEMTHITRVPKAPEYMEGVINLRGTVLPVVDTRSKIGMEKIEKTKDTCIIVLEIDVDDDKINLGTIVDSVKEVLEIEPHEILPPPNIGHKFQSEFIIGMYKVEEEFIMILDMNKIFSTDELISLKENFETQKV